MPVPPGHRQQYRSVRLAIPWMNEGSLTDRVTNSINPVIQVKEGILLEVKPTGNSPMKSYHTHRNSVQLRCNREQVFGNRYKNDIFSHAFLTVLIPFGSSVC